MKDTPARLFGVIAIFAETVEHDSASAASRFTISACVVVHYFLFCDSSGVVLFFIFPLYYYYRHLSTPTSFPVRFSTLPNVPFWLPTYEPLLLFAL
jgi:hypothetical protein